MVHNSIQLDLKIFYFKLDFFFFFFSYQKPLGHILLYMTTKFTLCRNKDVPNRINFRNY